MTTIYNPTNQTIEIVSGEFLFANETVTYLEYYAAAFVREHMHWNGGYKQFLTPKQWEQAYLMCDGYGTIDKAWAKEQCYDWSHVRDSSWQTLVKVADWIAAQKWHLGSIEAIVNQMLEDCERVGLDPIRAIPG